MGGTSGNPVRIGENAVHVIIAVGDEHPSPKLECVQFTINGEELPIIMLGEVMRLSDSLRVKELDKEIILKKNSTVKATVFASTAYGSSVSTIPYLLGFSYINEAQCRVQDPANIPGTTHNVVLTT